MHKSVVCGRVRSEVFARPFRFKLMSGGGRTFLFLRDSVGGTGTGRGSENGLPAPKRTINYSRAKMWEIAAVDCFLIRILAGLERIRLGDDNHYSRSTYVVSSVSLEEYCRLLFPLRDGLHINVFYCTVGTVAGGGGGELQYRQGNFVSRIFSIQDRKVKRIFQRIDNPFSNGRIGARIGPSTSSKRSNPFFQ